MENLKLYLMAVVVFTQMASVAGAGLVYNDKNVAKFRCTPWSPVQPPDTYKLTTGGVTVSFALTHIFCGEVHYRSAKGFHSTAARQINARTKSAKRVPGQPNQADIYDANWPGYIRVYFKTFFHPKSSVKGLSNCISLWAAECYKHITRNNYSGDCMHLTNIPSLRNGIRVLFRRGGQQQVTLTTAFPPANRNTNCKRCQIPQTLSGCNLMQ